MGENMGRMKEWFASINDKLGNRGLLVNSLMIRIFLLLNISIILAVSLVGIICFKTFEKTLVKEIGNNRVDVLRQIAERVKLVKNSANTLSNLYYYDKKLNDYLNSDYSNQAEINSYLKEITEKYKIAFNEVGIDYYVVVTGENGYNYYSDIGKEECNYIQPEKKIWYKDILLKNGDIYWVSNFKDTQKTENVFSAARVLKDTEGSQKGILLVNVNERLLYKTYENSLTEKNNIYIMDEKGSIVSSRDEKMIGMNFFHVGKLREIFEKNPYTIIDIGGRTALFTNYYEESIGWTILEEIPFAEVITSINNVRNITISVALIVILIGSIASYKFANKVADPIKQLCKFLYDIQDEHFNSECEVKGWTEISILSEGLNSMLRRIKNLLEGIKEKEKQKRKIELSFLQAQINPHFMYNTLFSIKCMVDMQKNEEAEKMLTAFIQLLRSTLSNPDEFITLEEEFKTLKQYALLQQFRYAGQFNIEFNLSKKISQYRIPKLLIQPLLENSIFHGIEAKKEEGYICISALEKDGDIIITIEDNGVGIPKGIIDKIEQGEKLNSGVHVGIFNVRERINLNFGDKYGIKIESKELNGTKILLMLPAIE